MFASAGADFVLVCDFIWQDSRGPQTALREAADAITQGFAASIAKTTVKEG
jgi:thiamine-phosphate pyrophosphorylase